jgi:hypothetical protein
VTAQEQKGGMGSTNIQVGTITTGLTYVDVREIATEIFDRNFADLANVAREVAAGRAEEIRDELIAKMQQDPKANAQSFAQVEKQMHLFEAQKAYAVSGDEDLKRLLVTALTVASSAPERSMKSIVLGEAIKIVALLTPAQLRALSVGFCVWYVNFGVSSLKDLFSKYIAAADLHVSELALTPGDLRHLEYLGCGTSGTHNLQIDTLLRGEYPGLIQTGFKSDLLPSLFAPLPVPAGLTRPSSRTLDGVEFAVRRSSEIEESVASPDLLAQCKNLLEGFLLDSEAIESEIQNFGVDEARFFHWWRSSQLAELKLTSAGIAIGYTFASERILLPDLDIFL